MAEGLWTDLPGRGVVLASGPEARAFLQDVITTNLDGVAATGAGYGGLLTPQGKVLFDFVILAEGRDYLFDLPAAKAGDFGRRLAIYRLRAAVEIVDLTGRRRVLAGWGGDGVPDLPGTVAADPRLAALGWRAVLPADMAVDTVPGHRRTSADAYAAHRIALGIPEGGADFAYGEVFPHDVDMDQLGGIDFRKGCYVGQEVVSRMEHRGTARRRIVQLRATGLLPAAGVPLEDEGRPVGTVTASSGNGGLGLVRLDRVRAALDAGRPVTAGGMQVTVELPPWARFAWPAGGGDDP